MEKKALYHDVQNLATTLVAAASVTDTPGERNFPALLHSLISQIPYFQKNPQDVEILPIPDDPLGRGNLFALVRGKGNECVILTGHYDVVQTSMYGTLEPWAFEPVELKKRILDMLKDTSSRDAPLFRLKEDLESGNFLPGRGILDMKSGLAAGISVLSRAAAAKEHKGSVLFLSVADEEGSSRGMRAAAATLPAYLAERGLRAAAVFNLDSAVDQESGEMGRAVFTGSVGKTLPFVYFIGKCTHAGAPFDGINPVLAASEFAREVECNPDALKERQVAPGEEAPPPTILYFREDRRTYDVTTPAAVFCAINVLSHTRGPEEILDSVRKMAIEAMDKAISSLRERSSTLSRRVSGHFSIPVRPSDTIEFREFAAAAERLEPGILEKVRARAAELYPADRVRQTLQILEELAPRAGVEGPAAVVGFAPPYYARAELDEIRYRDFVGMLRAELSEFGMETGTGIRVRPYFPGISDMSFLAPADSPGQRAYACDQSPVCEGLSDGKDMAGLDCPVLNLGPWGREYHQLGERVERKYAFTELPEILFRLVNSTLSLGSASAENTRTGE